MPSSKQCHQCGNDNNPAQAFCGNCGSPLSLDEYISAKVRDQLSNTIRDRDVLEIDSSIKVFTQAWGWIKTIFGIAATLLVVAGGGVIWKVSDFRSGVEQEISKQFDAAKAAIGTASNEAALQAKALKTATLQTQADISRQTSSLRESLFQRLLIALSQSRYISHASIPMCASTRCCKSVLADLLLAGKRTRCSGRVTLGSSGSAHSR